MEDATEKYWGDLVEKLKKQLSGLDLNPTPDNRISFHNRIYEAIAEAFHRGQKTP